MFLGLFVKAKRKHLKLRVWKKRFQEQWASLIPNFRPWVNGSVQVAWGPFYSGSLLIDRRFKKAKIIVQIPYDGYLSVEEQKILSRYSISRNELPYFIFFHEVSHLLDIMPFIQTSDYNGLKSYLDTHRQMAMSAKHYKELPFEKQADHYAYQMVMKNCKQAS